MNRYACILCVLLAATMLGSCTDTERPQAGGLLPDLLFGLERGSRRPLEQAGSYAEVFNRARMIMSQYYTVSSADQEKGVIVSAPKPLGPASGRRLLSASPGREIASIKIRSDAGRLLAIATVAVQRQESAAYQMQAMDRENYDSIPNKTPADLDAATTSHQNDLWETHSYNRHQERLLLDDLERALSMGEK